MAVFLTRFSWPLWGGGRKEKVPHSNGYSSKEHEAVKFPLVEENKTERVPPHRKIRRKEETRVDREYDVVLVASDGDWCFLSGSESDESDWSIGWSEPLGSSFQSNDDNEDSFAVLVPCYIPGCKEVVEGSRNVVLNAIKNLPNELSSAGSNYMEQWLTSLQNFEA